jgi:hypothetical protein
LSDYINKGLKTETFQMDKLGNLFLTVKILVIEAQNNKDIAQLALASLNQKNNQAHETDSEDEEELDGEKIY